MVNDTALKFDNDDPGDPGLENPSQFLLKGEQEEQEAKRKEEQAKKQDLIQRALRQAAIEGDVEEVKAILEEFGEAVHFTSASGTTALHEACHYGHVEVCQALIEAGADVDQLDVWGIRKKFLRRIFLRFVIVYYVEEK